MLRGVDVHIVRLMTNNPEKIEGLERWGITVRRGCACDRRKLRQ